MRFILEALINPFFIAFVLLLIAFFYAYHLEGKGKGLTLCLGTSIVVLWVFSTGWLPGMLTGLLERQYPFVQTLNKDIRFVVVLSGGQSNEPNLPANMQLSSASLQRLWEGIRLVKQLPEATLIVSGGAFARSEASEASNLAVLSQWCLRNKKRILLEEHSLNTAEQARLLRPMVQEQPFYLVTSAIHMPRAMSVMKAAGLHAIAAPTDFTRYWNDERWTKRFIPNPYNLVYSTILIHELAGRAYYSFLDLSSS